MVHKLATSFPVLSQLPDRNLVQRQAVAPRAEVQIALIRLPGHPHPEEPFVEGSGLPQVGHAQRKMAQPSHDRLSHPPSPSTGSTVSSSMGDPRISALAVTVPPLPHGILGLGLESVNRKLVCDRGSPVLLCARQPDVSVIRVAPCGTIPIAPMQATPAAFPLSPARL